MTKIKAVLDQETWVSVDVPEEFQAIVDSLSSEHSSNGVNMTLNHHDQFSDHNDSEVVEKSTLRNHEEKYMTQTLVYKGTGYHMVNW